MSDGRKQGLFESDEDYKKRIELESDEGTIERVTGQHPSQRLFESDDDYEERIEKEANERIIEDVTDNKPSQRLFESDDDYEERIEKEANESIIERATGNRPHQRLCESDDDYEERIEKEANEYNSDDNSSSKNGGCFLTSACIETVGLPDNCHELTVLRNFRDSYLAKQKNGIKVINEYYKVAPHVVQSIQNSPNRLLIFNNIFSNIKNAVSLIEKGKNITALTIYVRMFIKLKKQFYNKS